MPWAYKNAHPANTKHLRTFRTMSAQRLRRWPNIVQMFCVWWEDDKCSQHPAACNDSLRMLARRSVPVRYTHFHNNKFPKQIKNEKTIRKYVIYIRRSTKKTTVTT